MWLVWVELSLLVTGIIFYFLYTIVFYFWFIYLLDAIKRKRRFYKTTSRCAQGESDPHQQMLAYNAKTELIKLYICFCLNLVDWVGITFVATSGILKLLSDYQHEFPTNHLLPVLGKLTSMLNIMPFDVLFLVISLAIIGILCMYLSARYAQKSWITSERIPYWICFFLLSSIITQILVSICYTHIIGLWCDILLVTVSVLFAWKQYRKLNMVIQWSIVDLNVSGNIELLEKQIGMKRRFNRIFTTILIGVCFLSVAFAIDVICHTIQVIFLMYNHPFTASLLCDTSYNYPDSSMYAISFGYSIAGFLMLIGMLIGYISYIGYGLCTMYVVLGRLMKGKTGYRTHFHVDLSRPLI